MRARRITGATLAELPFELDIESCRGMISPILDSFSYRIVRPFKDVYDARETRVPGKKGD